MKKYLIVLFFISCFFYSYCKIHEYQFIQIGIIPNGKEKNNLDCWTQVGFGGVGHISPTIYTISTDNRFYFVDDRNNRIAIFDLELNYLNEIKNNTFKHREIRQIKIFDSGDIVFLDYYGLTKINILGEIIWINESKNLSRQIINKNNFFPYNDYVLYYDDNEKIHFYNEIGNEIDTVNTETLINSTKNNNIKHASNNKILNNIETKKTQDFLKNKNIFFNNDKIYSNNNSNFLTYFNFMKENNLLEDFSSIMSKDLSSYESNFDPYKNMEKLINYDADGNIYMTGFFNGRLVMVFSNHGIFRDAFRYDFPEYSNPQVAPNGDVFFWRVQEDGVYIFKVVRVW